MANPYVGPRPLGVGDPIFGREREIYELRNLLSSERIVLLYSPSGAGKTSLVSAGLIPRLKSRFDVWAPTRLNLMPAASLQAQNRYAWSAATVFEQEVPASLRRPAETFTATTIQEYVNQRPRRPGASRNVVLIFDQFEEVLRVDPFGIPEKKVFFQQLGELLTEPRIWALFLLREDYLAPLDPYCGELPTNFRNRYRIDLLGLDQASEAVSLPAAQAGRPFTPAAVTKLVDDLAVVKVQQPDGSFGMRVGTYVEPLQLQVVCRGLWDRVPPAAPCIDQEQIEQFGDTSQALSGYYAEQVRLVSKLDSTLERSIRDWFERKLITPDGVRNLVMRGPTSSEGLDNIQIGELVDSHLVRAEQRAGIFWYELVHDRLVEPVRTDNAAWREAHLHPVQKLAALWDAQGRPEGLLPVGEPLRDAEAWAQADSEAVTVVEQAFLHDAASKQRAIDKEKRQVFRLRLWAAIATLATVVACGFFAYAYYEYRLARSRELAASSLSEGSDGPAILQALDAVRAWRTRQAWQALESAYVRVSGPRFQGHQDEVTSIAFSPDGRFLASASKDGTARRWDVAAGNELQVLMQTGGSPVLGAAFDQDGSRIALARGDGTVRMVRNDAAGSTVLEVACAPPALDVSFGSQGRWLAASCGDNSATVWDARSGHTVAVLKEHSGYINQVRFDPAGARLVTTGKDGRTIIWRVETGTSEYSFREQQPIVAAAFLGRDTLETACLDGWLRLYRLGKDRQSEIGHFAAHAAGAWSLDSGTDSLMATGGVSGDVMLWRQGADRPFLAIPAPRGGEAGNARVALEPHGSHVAAARGNLIWLYNIDLDGLIADSHRRLREKVAKMDAVGCQSYFGTAACPLF